MALSPRQLVERQWRIEWVQFRRGIILGKRRRGRKKAVQQLAQAWLRYSNMLTRKLGSLGAVARLRSDMIREREQAQLLTIQEPHLPYNPEDKGLWSTG